MNTLIIYDSTGYVIAQMSGAVREPVGIPFIWSEVPDGKRVVSEIGVDVSVTPNVAILEDIPPTEFEELRLEQAQSNTEMIDLIMAMTGGM